MKNFIRARKYYFSKFKFHDLKHIRKEYIELPTTNVTDNIGCIMIRIFLVCRIDLNFATFHNSISFLNMNFI